MALKQDSNSTGLAIAEETSFGVVDSNTEWYAQEPNSYSDFGGELTMISRSPINPSRQKKKGVITDLDASGGFNIDVMSSNLIRLLQGFFFADAHEKVSTIPLNGAAIVLTNVDATNKEFEAAAGLDAFVEGSLLKGSNFALSVNNGLKRATAVAAGAVTVAETLSDETPSATAKIEAVGYQFASGDVNVVAGTNTCTLSCTAGDFTDLGLIVGETVFVGGDTTPTRFVNNGPGFARVASIAAKNLVFDDTEWTPVNETGTGLTIQIFMGISIKNENTAALIKRRTYQLERTLGSDDDGVQSEYLTKAVGNEFALNIPKAEKVTADLSYVACDFEQRTGVQGVKAGTRIAAPVENAFNTSSNIRRIKLNVVDPDSTNPDALFGFVDSATVKINNNVSPNKAVAYLGAFDTMAGDFEVSGSITAYFSENAAVTAVRNNADCAFSFIAAQDNTGFCFDIPLLGLGGGRVNIEKDQPVMVPLENAAAENANGYTMMATFFPYLPDVAMP